jgi:hypothetical protein
VCCPVAPTLRNLVRLRRPGIGSRDGFFVPNLVTRRPSALLGICRLTSRPRPFRGGCEGLAMLVYRTNLTLSALALSNGLNLGTRSFAIYANANLGGDSLRFRQPHHDVMRERMVWHVVSTITKPKDTIPPIPGSFIEEQPCQQSWESCLEGSLVQGSWIDGDSRSDDLDSRLTRLLFDRAPAPSFGTIVPTTGSVTRGANATASRPKSKPAGKRGFLKPPTAKAPIRASRAMAAAAGK